MNLYQIDEAIMNAFDAAVDEETGEIINEAAMENLNALEMMRDQKIENIALMIKNLVSDAEALKKEKMAFAKRQQAAENRAEWLKRYLVGALQGNKFQTAQVAISFRKSQQVEYTGSVDMLPVEYIRQNPPEINKDALKKALKEGKEIKGASLKDVQNIQIK